MTAEGGDEEAGGVALQQPRATTAPLPVGVKLCVFVCIVLVPIAFLTTGLELPTTELFHKLQGRVSAGGLLPGRRHRQADVELAQWAAANNFTLDVHQATVVAATVVAAPAATAPATPSGSAQTPMVADRAARACTYRKGPKAVECYEKLTAFFPVRRSAAKFILLGDSTMSHLFHGFSRHSGPKESSALRDCTKSKPVKTGCELMDVIGLSKPKDGWKKPDRNVEGPKNRMPYCTDCGGCKPSLASGSGCVGGEGASFLPVEFARDVEHPSELGGPTSQETVAYMLSQAPRDICVVNSGIHDMALKKLEDEQYVENVRWYLETLMQSKGCGRIVWLQTTSVRGPDRDGNDQHGNRCEFYAPCPPPSVLFPPAPRSRS